VDISTTTINLAPNVPNKSEIQKQYNKSISEPITFDKQKIDEISKDKESSKSQEKGLVGQQLSKEEVKEIAENINNMVKLVSSNLQFTVNEEANRIMIRVVDSESKEVIREVPPEQVLNANVKFREILQLTGILMEEKA
jgi:flagellar protein FlaG